METKFLQYISAVRLDRVKLDCRYPSQFARVGEILPYLHDLFRTRQFTCRHG